MTKSIQSVLTSFESWYEKKYRHATNPDATEHCKSSCDTRHEYHYCSLSQDKMREELKKQFLSSLTDLLHSEMEGIIMEDEDIPSVDATNQFYWEEQNDKIRERNELRASQRERLAKRIESITNYKGQI